MRSSCHALAAAVAVALSATAPAPAEQVLFESGTLGPTGVSWDDVFNQVVPASNLNSSSFLGVRFQLDQPVITSRIGGHFVGPPGAADDSFFGTIVALTDGDDFPDSPDLSTPDVLGTTTLLFPDTSQEVFGDLSLALPAGDYAVVFGSGLFATNGEGGGLRNNADLGNQEFIGFGLGFGWGSRSSGSYYRLDGVIVPEPRTIALALVVSVIASRWRLK